MCLYLFSVCLTNFKILNYLLQYDSPSHIHLTKYSTHKSIKFLYFLNTHSPKDTIQNSLISQIMGVKQGLNQFYNLSNKFIDNSLLWHVLYLVICNILHDDDDDDDNNKPKSWSLSVSVAQHVIKSLTNTKHSN